ncbi:hypothetical protein VSR69_45415, partial [Paraburkholderia phytofirmans]
IEIRVNGAALPCVPYDRLSEIDQAAVVDNKRLGHTLQMAQVIRRSAMTGGHPDHHRGPIKVKRRGQRSARWAPASSASCPGNS